MKLLFVIPDEIEEYNGMYYSNPISVMVDRYGIICDEMVCFAPIKETKQPKSDLITNNKVRFLNAPKINSLKNYLKYQWYKKQINTLVSEFDAIIVHVHTSFTSTIVVECARKQGKPYLTVVVGCPWDSLWNHGLKGKFIAPLAFYNLRKIQRNAQFSIYVTSKFLQKRYPSPAKQISCSNVELTNSNFSIANRKEKICNGILNGRKIATFAAVDVPYKGQKYVIKAIAELKKQGIEYEYYLAGSGDSSILEDLAEKLDVSDQVYFLGALPHHKIFDLLDNIDIYIQPSKQEGLPRALIEAMSRGCYCLGSDIAGIPELLDSQLLFKKGKIADIVKLLKDISINDRISQIHTNVYRANHYKKEILDKRREEFLKEFKLYIESHQAL